MTNPTIPLPVQEPAGAVEAQERERFEAKFPMIAGIERFGDGYAVKDSYANSYACDRYIGRWTAWLAAKQDAGTISAASEVAIAQSNDPGKDRQIGISDDGHEQFWTWVRKAYRDAEALNAVFSLWNMQVSYKAGWKEALASLQPVTQAAASNWRAVPGVVWYEDSASLIRRGSEDDYCARKGAQRIYFAAAEPVTQAKSEAVAWKCSNCGNTSDCRGVTSTDNWCNSCAAIDTMQPLYAAPQEAVERQPLTRELALLLAEKVESTRREDADITDSVLAFAQAVEHFHGIGPATQETQHG